MATSKVKRDMSLPQLPPQAQREKNSNSNSIIPRDQFTRKKLKDLHNFITQELKKRGTKTPHVFLPFRLRVDDLKLEVFLSTIFPNGEMIDTLKEAHTRRILCEFDEFTLICGLKYLWCRLPNLEIIGWENYLQFRRLEKEHGYPKDAFLRLMPKCVSTRAHASIVYDFLDLLVSIASYSQYNYLSGRKISKMASMWAFNSTTNSKLAFYDATAFKENSFVSGLDSWKQTCTGLFHLFLAFLRAMVPANEDQPFKGPKSLQSLLSTNSYPPLENLDSVKSVITIPCVHVRSTRRSSDPYALITKIRQNLKFDRKDEFVSVENYTILKNIFLKDSTNEIVSTLTDESRRILTRISDNPIPSKYDLYPGWTKDGPPQDPDVPLYSEISITSVTLQDYYIWTWLSSLASDQSSYAKSLFGRSIVVEAGLRGFQKWLILTETTMGVEEYLSKVKKNTDRLERPSKLSKNLPIPPDEYDSHPLPHVTKESLLPDISFKDEPLDLDDYTRQEQGKPYQGVISQPKSNADYSQYMRGLDDGDHLANDLREININKVHNRQRPKPPPLDLLRSEEPLHVNKAHKKTNKEVHVDYGDGAKRANGNSHNHTPQNLSYPKHDYPTEALQYVAQTQEFQEPYDSYQTPYDKPENPLAVEPFDTYHVPALEPPKKPNGLSSPAKKHLELPPPPAGEQISNGDRNTPFHPEKLSHFDPPADPYQMPTSRVNHTHHLKPNDLRYNAETYQQYQAEPIQQYGGYEDPRILPAPSSDAIGEKPKKKKKKKKTKHKDELAGIPVDQLPDGPPPPLPADMMQNDSHSNGLSMPSNEYLPSLQDRHLPPVESPKNLRRCLGTFNILG